MDVLKALVKDHLAGFGLLGGSAVEGHTPQQCIDPCVQLRQAEGLGQVIVRAAGETTDAILLGPQRRHQHHRYGLLAAYFIEQAEAVDAGKHDVQQHQVEAVVLHRMQGLGAGGTGVNQEAAVEEVLLQVLEQAWVIFGEEERGGHGWS
ncbi:hypothetical protein D3C80_1512870 [compost metagenome]